MGEARLSAPQLKLLQQAARDKFAGAVEVRCLRTAEALVSKGLLCHAGAGIGLSCSARFKLTDAGRAAIARATGTQADKERGNG